MATNRIYESGDYLEVAATAPTTPSSGDPVLFGQIPGVAVNDEDSDGNTVIQTSGVYDLPVTGADSDGNDTVAVGDIVYYDSGTLNKDSTNGTRFGYALEQVASAGTDTINVKIGY